MLHRAGEYARRWVTRVDTRFKTCGMLRKRALASRFALHSREVSAGLVCHVERYCKRANAQELRVSGRNVLLPTRGSLVYVCARYTINAVKRRMLREYATPVLNSG
jgi:hypothetical protein